MNGPLVKLKDFLIGDRLFNIPVYQRSYAWEERHLNDLWNDLYYLDASKEHHFGTILLKDSKETIPYGLKTFTQLEVIDGQQRITTILILMREIVFQMKAVGDKTLRNQASKLEEEYLKYDSLYKLNLLGSDGDFFRDYIMDEKEQLDEPQTGSQRRLADAKSFFNNKLNDEKKRQQPSEFVCYLTGLKQKIDRLELMQYLVTSSADAIRIFETVNDRGRPLSNLEKTKSILMHTSYLGLGNGDGAIEDRLQELNERFSRIYQCFEAVHGAEHIEWLDLDDIQRYHFIISVSDNKYALNYMDELKQCIAKKRRRDPKKSVEFVRQYASSLDDAFVSVKTMVNTRVKSGDEPGVWLDKVFKQRRLGNVFPLLISSWLRFGKEPDRMVNILKLIEAFIFRVYLVGRRRGDAAQGWFNGVAQDVHRKRLNYDSLVDTLKQMNHYYKPDASFGESLRSGEFYHNHDRRTIKYLLSEYEIDLRCKSGEPLPLAQDEILSGEYQVEHIWPKNPADLSEDMVETHEKNVHRLGNLTLASSQWNNSMGNRPFDEKKRKYRDSSLRVQRELTAEEEWNDSTIEVREDRIVEFALRRWAI